MKQKDCMKRVGFIYEKIISVDNCKTAILNASKGKKNRSGVQTVLDNIDFYANDLSERLQQGTFVTPYRPRTIQDGSSKKIRVIQVPAFYPDQCSHHAIIQVLMPIIKASSYYWSCANMPNKGIDLASIGVERATKKDTKHAKYCVKLDIRKFYPSVPHDRLKARFREKIKDEKALRIIDAVIDSHDEGLPIGNYTSPWFAEFYLQPLDHYIKQELKVKHYIRYADDMVLLGGNKKELRKAMEQVMNFIGGLGLETKHNFQLFRVYRKGKGRKIDFIGRCFGIEVTTIRKWRALALMRQSRKIQKLQKNHAAISFRMASGFISRCSCFKHTNSYGMRKKYYETVNINDLKEVIRHESQRKLRTSVGNS